MKPKILIVPNIEDNKISIDKKYIRAIEVAGGIPLMLTYTDDINVDEYLKLCDGVLFTGGGDVNTTILNIEDNIYNDAVPLVRDIVEIKLIKKCIDMDIPTLCICRGVQVLNVATGGSLIQHILNHTADKQKLHHDVLIKKDSKLFEAINDVELKVNSYHHQVIGNIGNDIKICSFSKDGYVEAIECINKKFILGVQWHPEYLIDKCTKNCNLFKLFIKHCL